jgi:hypothetical protein
MEKEIGREMLWLGEFLEGKGKGGQEDGQSTVMAQAIRAELQMR